MRIGVTKKVKNFEINPIFAKKVIQKKMTGGGHIMPPLTLNRVKLDKGKKNSRKKISFMHTKNI